VAQDPGCALFNKGVAVSIPPIHPQEPGHRRGNVAKDEVRTGDLSLPNLVGKFDNKLIFDNKTLPSLAFLSPTPTHPSPFPYQSPPPQKIPRTYHLQTLNRHRTLTPKPTISIDIPIFDLDIDQHTVTRRLFIPVSRSLPDF
jgi:hypothetical protein